MASSKGGTSAARSAAEAPSPGGSELKAAAVERQTGSTTKSAESARRPKPSGRSKALREAEPTALQPSPGGSEMHQEAVLEEIGQPKGHRAKSERSPSSRGAQATLRGRFSPGTVVQLVKVAGAHVLRTAPGDEVVEEKKVDKNGHVQFKGLEKDGRYFIRGYQAGFPLEIRVRGRAEADDSEVLAQDPVGYDEVRTRDGRVFGERGQRIPDTPEHLAH